MSAAITPPQPVNGRAYTSSEIEHLIPSGWQFTDVTTLLDTEAVFMCTGFEDPTTPLDWEGQQ